MTKAINCPDLLHDDNPVEVPCPTCGLAILRGRPWTGRFSPATYLRFLRWWALIGPVLAALLTSLFWGNTP